MLKNLSRVPCQGAEPVELVEDAGKTAREFVRVLKEHVDEYGKAHLECDHVLVLWVGRLAAMLSSRYSVRT